MSTAWLDVAKRFDLAIRNRDLRAALRLAAKIHRHVRPDEPVDLERVRVMVSCYAGELYGLELR